MKTNPFNESLIRPNDKFGRFLFKIVTYLAICGGIVLVVIVLINFVSIAGRTIFGKPLTGDFELVEMGCAIAIFSFLPICHFKNGNVIVDFFSSRFPTFIKQILDIFSNLIFLMVSGFFSFRMIYGVLDMIKYNEQTMLLKLPVWIAFIPGIFSFFLLTIVCFYILLKTITQFQFKKI